MILPATSLEWKFVLLIAGLLVNFENQDNISKLQTCFIFVSLLDKKIAVYLSSPAFLEQRLTYIERTWYLIKFLFIINGVL